MFRSPLMPPIPAPGKTMPKGPLLRVDLQQTFEKREKWRKQKKEWRDKQAPRPAVDVEFMRERHLAGFQRWREAQRQAKEWMDQHPTPKTPHDYQRKYKSMVKSVMKALSGKVTLPDAIDVEHEEEPTEEVDGAIEAIRRNEASEENEAR